MAHIKYIPGMLRWPNLLMMAASLILTRYFLLMPIYAESQSTLQMGPLFFWALVFATLLIGAGGYIVNDILDTGLDELNKPGKNLVGTRIPEKDAWTWYYILNAAGIALGALVSYYAGKLELGILFLLIATALYYYSLKYKYLAFWGNFVVSLLTALTVAIVWLFEFFYLKQSAETFISVSPSFETINMLILGYALLSFVVTFTREIAKDTEDQEGDRRHGCQTIPIVLGERRTRIILVALLFITILMIALAQWHLHERYLLLAAFLGLVQAIALVSVYQLARPVSRQSFRLVSLLAKWMMVTGLVSMVFLRFPT